MFNKAKPFKRFWSGEFLKYVFKRHSDENDRSPIVVDTGSVIHI